MELKQQLKASRLLQKYYQPIWDQKKENLKNIVVKNVNAISPHAKLVDIDEDSADFKRKYDTQYVNSYYRLMLFFDDISLYSDESKQRKMFEIQLPELCRVDGIGTSRYMGIPTTRVRVEFNPKWEEKELEFIKEIQNKEIQQKTL